MWDRLEALYETHQEKIRLAGWAVFVAVLWGAASSGARHLKGPQTEKKTSELKLQQIQEEYNGVTQGPQENNRPTQTQREKLAQAQQEITRLQQELAAQKPAPTTPQDIPKPARPKTQQPATPSALQIADEYNAAETKLKNTLEESRKTDPVLASDPTVSGFLWALQNNPYFKELWTALVKNETLHDAEKTERFNELIGASFKEYRKYCEANLKRILLQGSQSNDATQQLRASAFLLALGNSPQMRPIWEKLVKNEMTPEGPEKNANFEKLISAAVNQWAKTPSQTQ